MANAYRGVIVALMAAAALAGEPPEDDLPLPDRQSFPT